MTGTCRLKDRDSVASMLIPYNYINLINFVKIVEIFRIRNSVTFSFFLFSFSIIPANKWQSRIIWNFLFRRHFAIYSAFIRLLHDYSLLFYCAAAYCDESLSKLIAVLEGASAISWAWLCVMAQWSRTNQFKHNFLSNLEKYTAQVVCSSRSCTNSIGK